MPLIASSMPNLVAGVSQQPPTLRTPTSCDEMFNAWPSMATGLNKRPPTEWIAKLTAVTPTNGAVGYLIDREGTYRFILVLSGADMYAYDIQGVAQTISFPSGKAYLATPTPLSSFKFLTVGDTTFIANRDVTVTTTTVAEDGTRLDPSGRATLYVTQSYSNTVYAAYINGVLKASFTTSNGISTSVESTSAIATALGSALITSGYTLTVYGSTIELSGLAGGTTVRGYSSQGDHGLKWYTDAISEFTGLPPSSVNGRLLKIRGDLKTNGDDYFVYYKDGLWIECAGYGAWEKPNPATMPWKIVYNGGTNWTFQQHTWSTRLSGDASSNPNPSFIGNTIMDMFFYTNRLGFLSDENIILSESNHFETFYRTTLATLVDNDRMDLAVFNTGVDILRHAIPFDKDLLIMSDRAQYRFAYQNYLGPKNSQISFSTSFNVSPSVKPVNVGSSVYFVDDRSEYQYVKMFEFSPQQNRVGDDADEATAPIPSYIPSGVQFSSGSSRVKSMVSNSSLTPDTLYLYKFFWNGQNKVQNSWFKWQFPDCVKVHWAGFSKNYLYLVIERSDGVHFERIRMDEAVFTPRTSTSPTRMVVDRQIPKSKVILSYNSTTNLTTVTLPYATNGTVEIVGCLMTGLTSTYIYDQRMAVTRVNSTTVTVPNDITGYTYLTIGIQYDFLFRFNQVFLRDKVYTGSGMNLIANLDAGRLQMRYVTLATNNTTYFYTLLKYAGRADFKTEFTSNKLGSPYVILGDMNYADDVYRVPLMGNSQDMVLEIHNDSPFPSTFASAEWQMIYSPKAAQRM